MYRSVVKCLILLPLFNPTLYIAAVFITLLQYCPLKWICSSLIPYVILFGREAFNSLLSLDETMTVEPHDED